MKHKILVELISKLAYYGIVFLIYKHFGYAVTIIYLLACLNTKLVRIKK